MSVFQYVADGLDKVRFCGRADINDTSKHRAAAAFGLRDGAAFAPAHIGLKIVVAELPAQLADIFV